MHNCGGPDWIPILALVVSLIGLGIAIRALYYTSEQHKEWVRRVKGRARLKVVLTTDPAPDSDGVIRTEGTGLWPIVHIGIDNNAGEIAAGPTLINALIPKHFAYFKWCGVQGEDIPESGKLPAQTSEGLPGHPEGSQYQAIELARIGRRSHYMKHVRFNIPDLPDTGEVAVPVRVKVQADELPHDLDEVIVDESYRFARRAPAA